MRESVVAKARRRVVHDELEGDWERASSARRSAHAVSDHHLVHRDQLRLWYYMYTFQPERFADILEAVQPDRCSYVFEYFTDCTSFRALYCSQSPPSITSATLMMEYHWRPLDNTRKEIRVLDLDPGTGAASLGGQLRHVFLDESDKPDYQAISYAWVDTALVDSISVDGKRIPIPASAGSALRCMRLSVGTRSLWIDCICIDQNNDHEKGHQVALMADIFQNSSETLAHLGDDVDNTAERGFWGLQVVCNAWIESKTSNYGEQSPEGRHRLIEDREIRHWSYLRKRIDLVAIKAIISMPYFK